MHGIKELVLRLPDDMQERFNRSNFFQKCMRCEFTPGFFTLVLRSPNQNFNARGKRGWWIKPHHNLLLKVTNVFYFGFFLFCFFKLNFCSRYYLITCTYVNCASQGSSLDQKLATELATPNDISSQWEAFSYFYLSSLLWQTNKMAGFIKKKKQTKTQKIPWWNQCLKTNTQKRHRFYSPCLICPESEALFNPSNMKHH